jgi:outer membrane protein TolC
MKLLKIVVLSITLITSQAFAGTAPANFVLNQQTLQNQLLNNNVDLLQALNSVHMAKDQVNIARAQLLPSLNLNGMLNFAGGGVFLSSFDFLLPFLVPSNWHNYSAQKNLFQAEKISYHVIQNNTYGSALSVYFALVADRQLQSIYQQQYHDLMDVFEIHKKRNSVGLAPVSDVMEIQAQAQLAGVRASSLAALSKQEIASVRSILSLPLQTNISLEYSNMDSSPWEYEGLQATANKANEVSLERAQIQYLIKAASAQKWSKVFSFINGISVGGRSSGAGIDAGFQNMQASGSMSLGFDQFPTYELNERRIYEIRLQDQSLQLENTRIVESTVNSLEEGRHQLELSTQAETEMAQVYQIRVKDYEQGGTPWLDVILSRSRLVEAQVAKVRAQLDVNLQRAALHRALRTAQFARITGCSSSANPPIEKNTDGFIGAIRGAIGNARGKNRVESHKTLDQICRGR